MTKQVEVEVVNFESGPVDEFVKKEVPQFLKKLARVVCGDGTPNAGNAEMINAASYYMYALASAVAATVSNKDATMDKEVKGWILDTVTEHLLPDDEGDEDEPEIGS